MTALVLGLVGGAIGFAIGGPLGYAAVGMQIGFLAGTLVGSLIDPPKVQGPRLGDLKLQKSTYGSMHPWVWGTGRIAGNVIDQTDLEEHKHKSSGKGGPQVTSYTYSASFAIALCQTPVFGRDAIIGILRIWADGRLIWDASTDVDVPCTVYVGSETQTADPTFEAIHGVGNQPAYRGIAYLVFTDYDLTDFGNRIPNIEVELYTNEGTEYPTRVSTFGPWNDPPSGNFRYSVANKSGILTTTSIEPIAGHTFYRQQWQIDGTEIGSLTSTTTDLGGPSQRSVRNLNAYNRNGSLWFTPDPDDPTMLIAAGTSVGILAGNDNIFMEPWIYGVALVPGDQTYVTRYYAPGGIPGNYSGVLVGLGAEYPNSSVFLGSSDDGSVYASVPTGSGNLLWKFDEDLNLIHFWDAPDTAGSNFGDSANYGNFFVHRNSIVIKTAIGPTSVVALTKIDPVTFSLTDVGSTLDSHNTISANFTVSIGGCLGMDEDGVFNVCAPPAPVLLSQIVSDLTENTPLGSPGSPSTMEYDVTELTDEVRWYVIASQMTVRNAIQGLRPIFFFDAVESDDLVKFRKRGTTASIATIPDDDLCARPGGEEAGDPLQTKRKREQELPRTVTLTYIDVDNDYQTGAQNSPRQTTLSEQDVTLEVAVGLTADEALQKCLTVHTAEWVERESFEFSTTRKWAYLDVCDVVTVRGRVIRLRQRTESPDGTIKWEGVLNAPSLYTQTAPGAPSEGFTPQEPPGTPVDTEIVLLDIPILSLDDAPYGFYAAAGPQTPGRWSGYGLYKSLDGGTSYELVASSEEASIIGRTQVSTAGSPTVTGTLSAYAGGDVVEEASLCVLLTDADAELVSVTTAALLNGANLCAISRGTTTSGSPACTVNLWELLQFRDAVLVGAGQYVISGFLRGRKGTTTSGHGVGDRFVFLPVTNVDAPVEEIGVCLDYKAVTYGQAIGDVTARDFINTGQSADSFFEEVGGELPPFTGDAGSPTNPSQGQVPAPSPGDCAANKFLSACGDFRTTPVYAPTDATYIVNSLNSTLTNELVLTAGNNVTLTAGSGTLTINAAGGGGSVIIGGNPAACGGRLTLTSAVPVTTTDVTGAATIYFTPYIGAQLSLYNGVDTWTTYAFTELSLGLGTLAAAFQAYDVFVYEAGSPVIPTLEFTEWANAAITVTIASPGVVTWTGNTLANGNSIVFTTTGALPTGLTANTRYYVVAYATTFSLATTPGGTAINTTGSQSGVHTGHASHARQTALVMQNGVLCKSGDTTRRYLGTFLSTATTTTEDSLNRRYLWNKYNQVPRTLGQTAETTNSWTYTTLTWRQANANIANMLDYVTGDAATWLAADVHGLATCSVANSVAVGVGINTTSANSSPVMGGSVSSILAETLVARYRGYAALGRNFIPWLEISVATGATTFYGDAGNTVMQTGIMGSIDA